MLQSDFYTLHERITDNRNEAEMYGNMDAFLLSVSMEKRGIEAFLTIQKTK